MIYRYTITCENDSDSVVLDLSPEGWNKKGLTWIHSNNYWGMLRSVTVNKLGFVRDKKYKIGGQNFILAKYELYGVQADLSIKIEQRNSATNDYDITYFDGKLVWLNSPEQDLDFVMMGLVDGSDENNFSENDELELSLDSTVDIFGNTITPASSKNVLHTGQDLYLQAVYDADTDIPPVSGETNNIDIPTNTDGSKVTDNIIDDITIDGVQKTIYTNNTGETIDFTVDIDGTRDIDMTVFNSNLDSEARFTVNYNFYIEKNNVLDTTIDTEVQNITFTTAQESYNFSANASFNKVFTLADGDSIQLYSRLIITIDGINATSYNYELQNRFTLDLLLLTNTPTDSYTKMYLSHEVCENLLQQITGNTAPLYSPILGRTDLGYSSDGALSLVGFTDGFNIRNFPSKPIKDNFKDVFTSLFKWKPIFMEYDRVNNRFVIDDLDNRFKDVSLGSFDDPADWKRIIDSKRYFNVFKTGQKNKVEYEELNGVEEANVPAEYGSNLSFKNIFDHQTVHNTDATGLEVVRREQYLNTGVTDTKWDEIKFMVQLERDGGSGFRTKKLGSGEEAVNIFNASTRLNLERTPHRNLRSAGKIISSIYHKNSSGEYPFLNSQKSSDLGTKLSGDSVFIYEDQGFNVSNLDDPYYIPELIEFSAPVTASIIAQLNSDPNGYFTVSNRRGDYKIFPIDVKTEAYDRKGNWVGLVKYITSTPLVIYKGVGGSATNTYLTTGSIDASSVYNVDEFDLEFNVTFPDTYTDRFYISFYDGINYWFCRIEKNISQLVVGGFIRTGGVTNTFSWNLGAISGYEGNSYKIKISMRGTVGGAFNSILYINDVSQGYQDTSSGTYQGLNSLNLTSVQFLVGSAPLIFSPNVYWNNFIISDIKLSKTTGESLQEHNFTTSDYLTDLSGNANDLTKVGTETLTIPI